MNIASSSITQQLAAAGVSYAPQIVSAAQRHGLDPSLLAAVAAQETGGPGSNGGANVLGDGGHGHGLFQIDDRWHNFARTAGAMDPGKNADYAAGMLSGLLQRYGGDVRKALSAYNAGAPGASGTKTTWGDGRTLGYADSVLRHYQQLDTSNVEDARADQATASQSITGLSQLLQAIPAFTPAAAPACAAWRPQRGLDATGHSARTSTTYDSYINGDDQ